MDRAVRAEDDATVVDLQQLSAFCAMSLLLSAVPGPSVLFVVGRALAHGRRAALASALGNALGGYALVVAVALGLGSLVARSEVLFTAVRLGGAAYLVFLGVRAVRDGRGVPTEGGATAGAGATPTRHGGARRTWEGFTVGVTNPKSIVFLMAVLPQFVDREAGHVVGQMLLLGLAGALLQLGSDSVWAWTAAAARSWLARSPRRLRLFGGAGGMAMIGLGVTVAVTGRAD